MSNFKKSTQFSKNPPNKVAVNLTVLHLLQGSKAKETMNSKNTETLHKKCIRKAKMKNRFCSET